jgi:hypothetical protein
MYNVQGTMYNCTRRQEYVDTVEGSRERDTEQAFWDRQRRRVVVRNSKTYATVTLYVVLLRAGRAGGPEAEVVIAT